MDIGKTILRLTIVVGAIATNVVAYNHASEMLTAANPMENGFAVLILIGVMLGDVALIGYMSNKRW